MTETLLATRRRAQGFDGWAFHGHGVRLLRPARGSARCARARPVDSSMSISTPASRTSRLATSNAAGIWVRKRCSTRSERNADDALVGPGHPGVGEEGGALRQDPLVGGRHVGVRADDAAHPAVEIDPQRLLLARRLGVEVDEDDLDLLVEVGQEAVGDAERRIEVLHEDLALEIDRRHLDPRRRLADVEPAPRGALRVVRRPQQPRLVHQQSRTSFLSQTWLPVVKAVDRQLVELGQDLRRHAEAAGHVLDVDHDVVDPVLVDQLRQQALQRLAPGLADHVADEQQLHRAYSTARVSRMTVTLIWPG